MNQSLREVIISTLTHQKLFSPIQIGVLKLSHRIVMAPLTRLRSQIPGDVPIDLMAEYYGQRASEGGLLISEGTPVSIPTNKLLDGGGSRMPFTQRAGTFFYNFGMLAA